MIIEVVLDDTPEGWQRMPVQEVYRRGKALVLLGIPGENHDCDAMRCRAIGHVIAFAEIVKADNGGDGANKD